MKNLALLLAAPVMGALFVVFLPVAGFMMVGAAVCKKIASGMEATEKMLAV